MALAEFKTVVPWQGDRLFASWGKEFSKRLKTCATEYHRTLVTNISRPSRKGRSSAGGYPGADQGQLRRGVIEDFPDDFTARMGIRKGIPYAMLHELGGIIHPKNKRRLAVPVSPQAIRHMRSGASAWDFTPGRGRQLVKIIRAGRPPLLVEKVGGRNSRSIIHFVLTENVRIPARPYIRPTFMDLIPRFEQILLAPLPT